MVPLYSPEFSNLSKFLRKYDRNSIVAQLAGLLTFPELAANTIRIEILIHLAISACQGSLVPSWTQIRNLLNRQLERTSVPSLEDPIEDVFITNVESRKGNRLLFEGGWESSDYYTNSTLRALEIPDAPPDCAQISHQATALLTLGHTAAKRLGLCRWQLESSTPNSSIRLTPAHTDGTRSRSLLFSNDDLNALGICRKSLEAFIIREKDIQKISSEEIGQTSLERRPILEVGDALLLALPTAISTAIRRFTLDSLKDSGLLPGFAEAISNFQAAQVEREGLRELKGKALSLTPPSADDDPPPLHGWLLKYDSDKFLQILLLHDDLESARTSGFSSFNSYSEIGLVHLEKYISKVADQCKSLPDFSEGMTLFILGGVGRGFSLRFRNWPDSWRFSVIRISDLLMLAAEPEGPINRYLKLLKQKNWVEEQGVKFNNINGDFNLYCSWQRFEFQLIPRDIPVSNRSLISIATDMVLPIRHEIRKLSDQHQVTDVSGENISVIRLGQNAFFESMRELPVYASLKKSSAGRLAGVCETERGPSWLVVDSTKSGHIDRRALYELWSGLIELFLKLVEIAENLFQPSFEDPIEVELNFSTVSFKNDYVDALSPTTKVGQSEIRINHERKSAEITFPENLLTHFRGPENTGEKFIVRDIARSVYALFRISGADVEDPVIDSIVNEVVGDAGMRLLHMFEATNPIDYLLFTHSGQPKFLAHEDFVFAKLNLTNGCTSANPGTKTVSKYDTNEILKKIVEKIWLKLREKLSGLDRRLVLREAIRIQETMIQDRLHWQRTSKAMLSLYAHTEEVFSIAQSRESRRAATSLASRTVIEMAVCECPASGGKSPSNWELDELLANAALLVEVAMDSDAIHLDFVEPWLILHENGEYSVDKESRAQVLEPFRKAYFEYDFQKYANEYENLYRSKPALNEDETSQLFSPRFVKAFESEFGLTPDDTFSGLAGLIDLAVEQDSVIVETTIERLRAALVDSQGMSPDSAFAFLQTFGLFHRPAWEIPPDGYLMKDLHPWRFRRRLSATARPISIFGNEPNDPVIFGIGSLKLGFEYLIFRTEQGQLPQRFFTSSEMQKYIGYASHKRGHEFTELVAKRLGDAGWSTRTEINMTELGANPELGDIDVLAWKPNQQVQIIECKDLQLARTIAEIGEICRRFRGDAEDELGKHLARVNWIENQPAAISRIVEFEVTKSIIDHRLITNTHVPITYLSSLPLPAEKIGTLSDSGMLS